MRNGLGLIINNLNMAIGWRDETDVVLHVTVLKPPMRGYTPQNSNSLLSWRNDKEISSLWGGHTM